MVKKHFKKIMSLIFTVIFILGTIGNNPVTTYSEGEAMSIASEDDLLNVLNYMEKNPEEEVEATLEADITVTGSTLLIAGTLTLNGNGHTVTLSHPLSVYNATLNLKDNLTFIPGDEGYSALVVDGTGILNMYDGVTIKDFKNASQIGPGGVEVTENAVFNMYGGTITGCDAGCYYADETNKRSGGGVQVNGSGTFNMYDGVIDGCKGFLGGGVGVEAEGEYDVDEYGESVSGFPTFHMMGGTISNCESLIVSKSDYVSGVSGYQYKVIGNLGGGGVCIFAKDSGASFVMDGGTIENNITNIARLGSVYALQSGGGIYVYSNSDKTYILTVVFSCIYKAHILGNNSYFCLC